MASNNFIKVVTMTGADNSIDYHDLHYISRKYPFVEWGILLSKNSEGYNRFPTRNWIEGLITENDSNATISGHICGSWVRDIIQGGNIFIENMGDLRKGFSRFQLNFHAQSHFMPYPDKYIQSLVYLTKVYGQQVIFQNDEVNNNLFNYAKERNINAVSLYDISGGAGLLPKQWPKPNDFYCGYAGGLSPDNLSEQLVKIQSILNDDTTIWIDAETHIRSNNDSLFDLNKVVKFLEIAKPFVKEVK